MSFSANVKNELSRIIPEDSCCQLAEISGFLRMSGTIQLAGRGKMNIKLVTENAAAARKIIKLLKIRFDIHTELEISRTNMIKKHNFYRMKIKSDMKSEEILRETGVLTVKDGLSSIDYSVPEEIIEKRCCKRAFLRGSFLGSGSITDPEKSYHLEIVANSLEESNNIIDILSYFELTGKVIERKKHYVVYLKEGEQIIDFLNIVGAYSSLMEFENVRIVKELRNNVNRIVNCETANLNKIVNASVRQVTAIKEIMAKKGLGILNDNLRDVAEARLENPDVSLKELGELMSPPVGKSGVNHRMKKIEEIAESMKHSTKDSDK